MIRFACKCGFEFNVTEDRAGHMLQCPRCSLLVDVPRREELSWLGPDGTYAVTDTKAGRRLPKQTVEGYSATNLQFAGPAHVWERAPMAVMNRVHAQSAEMGALPTLFAAVTDLPSGTFVGPDGLQDRIAAAIADHNGRAIRRNPRQSRSSADTNVSQDPALIEVDDRNAI